MHLLCYFSFFVSLINIVIVVDFNYLQAAMELYSGTNLHHFTFLLLHIRPANIISDEYTDTRTDSG